MQSTEDIPVAEAAVPLNVKMLQGIAQVESRHETVFKPSQTAMKIAMMKLHLYQLTYSELTKAGHQPGTRVFRRLFKKRSGWDFQTLLNQVRAIKHAVDELRAQEQIEAAGNPDSRVESAPEAEINLLSKDDDVRNEGIRRLKGLRDYLPPAVLSAEETDATSESAGSLRGMRSPILHMDTMPFIGETRHAPEMPYLVGIDPGLGSDRASEHGAIEIFMDDVRSSMAVPEQLLPEDADHKAMVAAMRIRNNAPEECFPEPMRSQAREIIKRLDDENL